MLGGYQILDLRNIDLSRGTSESSITDVEVLKQLSQIADHIQKTYDFSKPLHNQLKPVLIRYRDKKVGEKHEVALYGNIEVINVYYKFRIVANNEGEQLTINVEFEEKTDEYDNKYWSIKTAKILLTSEVAIFENITDKDGHKRYVEGSGTVINMPEGFEVLYNKWSLSGSHLMFVLYLKNPSEDTTVATFGIKVNYDLPQWIKDKIYTPSSSYAVAFNDFIQITAGATAGDKMKFAVRKDNDVISVDKYYQDTFKGGAYTRVSFDLLIDNESQN